MLRIHKFFSKKKGNKMKKKILIFTLFLGILSVMLALPNDVQA